jgi:oxygen-independent coproporphyrinogen-3 oxidase
VRTTAAQAAALAPSRLAIFGYAHVPWFKTHQRLIDTASLPGAAERLAQAEASAAVLADHGYVAIGLDHFARPDDPMALALADGSLGRNFQGYTTDAADALLGLGVSSIGRLPQGFVQNAADTGAWRRAIEAGTLPVVRGVAFTDDDRLRADVIERLMCDFAVDFGAIALAQSGQADALDDAFVSLGALEADGMVVLNGRHVAMTEAGRPFVRLAAAAFDAYLDTGRARHSVAV